MLYHNNTRQRMKGQLLLILFIPLMMTSLADAAGEDIFSYTGQPESVEVLSSKIMTSYPRISRQDAVELAEAVQLIQQLEREIYLTHQLLGIREEEGRAAKEMPAQELTALDKMERIKEAKRAQYKKSFSPFDLLSSGKKHVVAAQEVPEESMVLAKQISEVPERNIPRQDKSLMTDIEKKYKAGAKVIPPTQAAIPTGRIRPTGKVGADETSAAIEKGEAVFVSVPGLRRFMSTDPSVLRAFKEDEDKINVTGLNLGEAYLHIWDKEGRHSIKFTVMQVGYQTFAQARKRALEAAKMESFKIRYSFDRYRLNSKSFNPSRSYHFTEWFHRLGVRGETPWGIASSRLQYEGREVGRDMEDLRDLTAWDFNLWGDELGISLGNTGASFSEITLPSTAYQGVRFKYPDYHDVAYDIVWGARGDRMWGGRISGWKNANYFWGARGKVRPTDWLSFNTTFLKALEDDEDIAEYQYAGGFGLDFWGETLQLEAEFARSKSEETEIHDHAYKIDADLDLKESNVSVHGTYRDIGPRYMLVTGALAPHAGIKGYDVKATYYPSEQFRMTSDFRYYRDRRSFNPTETQRYNFERRHTFDLGLDDYTKLGCMFFKNTREGDEPPTRSSGSSYTLSHALTPPKPLSNVDIYLQFTPTQYKNLSDDAASYRERRTSVGFHANAFSNLYYDLSYNWHYRKMRQSGESGTMKTLLTGLLYSSQIFDTPFYTTLTIRYKKEFDVMYNLPLSANENVISAGGEITYRPSSDFETYLRLDYSDIKNILDHNQNRKETRIYGGGSYFFDTTMRWGVGGSIRGYVFEDINKNGRREKEERGIPRVTIYAGKLRSTKTDEDGAFEFRRLKDAEALVMVDTKMLPKGYKPTTPTSRTTKLERGLISETSFGFVAVAEVSGVVFNDVNMNGVFDAGDKGVGNVLLVADDGTMASSKTDGSYKMDEVKRGTMTLTLDTVSLPPNLLPLKKTKKTLEVVEGEEYRQNFPLYALRTVIGTVYVDENGNGKFDVGEKGVAEVELKVEDTATITDEKGRYFLKKLKGGTQTIEVIISTIPTAYEMAESAFKEVTLSVDGEIKENVNFALKRR